MTLTLLGAGSESILAELSSAGVSYSIWLADGDEDLAGNVSIRVSRSTSPAILAGVLVAWVRARTSRRIALRVDGVTRVLKDQELTVKESSLLLAQGENIMITETKGTTRKPKAPSTVRRLVNAPSRIPPFNEPPRRRAYRE